MNEAWAEAIIEADVVEVEVVLFTFTFSLLLLSSLSSSEHFVFIVTYRSVEVAVAEVYVLGV